MVSRHRDTTNRHRHNNTQTVSINSQASRAVHMADAQPALTPMHCAYTNTIKDKSAASPQLDSPATSAYRNAAGQHAVLSYHHETGHSKRHLHPGKSHEAANSAPLDNPQASPQILKGHQGQRNCLQQRQRLHSHSIFGQRLGMRTFKRQDAISQRRYYLPRNTPHQLEEQATIMRGVVIVRSRVHRSMHRGDSMDQTVDLGYKQNEPTRLHMDNQGAIAVGNHPMIGDKPKHVKLRYHYVKE